MSEHGAARQHENRQAEITPAGTAQGKTPRGGAPQRDVKPGEGRPGDGRQRLEDAALELFAAHGVSGTSLQMIADRLGVTKAAVYHHYKTKDAIVLQVVAPALDQLATIAGTAESRRGTAAREAALSGLVESLVANRRVYGVLLGDLAVARLLHSHPPLQALVQRITDLLTGPAPDEATRTAVALVVAGLPGAAVHPLTASLDDDALRRHLLDTARRALVVRRPRPAAPDPADRPA